MDSLFSYAALVATTMTHLQIDHKKPEAIHMYMEVACIRCAVDSFKNVSVVVNIIVFTLKQLSVA